METGSLRAKDEHVQQAVLRIGFAENRKRSAVKPPVADERERALGHRLSPAC